MSNNKINNIYTVEDIHDYVSGKMTATEMHDIEKAALGDPLLAEAIEGYSSVPEFTEPKGFENMNEHLVDLKTKFVGTDTKVVTIRKYNIVWRAAAAILLLIGAGVLINYLTNTSTTKQPTVATIQSNKPATVNTLPTIDSSKEVNADNKTATNKITTDPSPTHSSSKKITDNKTVEPVQQSNKEIVANANSIRSEATTTQSDISAVMPSPEKELNEIAARKKEVAKKIIQNDSSKIFFSGRVVDNNNNPIPFASIKTEEGLISATDKNGAFSLSVTRKKIGKITFSGNNFLQKTITPSEDLDVIVLENNRVSNSRNNNSNQSGNPAQITVLYKIGAVPEDGWSKYINYLVNKLSYSEYDNGKAVVGETIVKFEIDPFGLPHAFVFEKQIDSDVNDALEDVIVTGPDWKVTDKSALPRIIKLKIIF